MILLATTGGGCLDLLGHEEDVIDHAGVQQTSQLQDDRVEDKHPVFDPSRTVVDAIPRDSFQTCPIEMNKSATITRLDIVPFTDASAPLAGKLFRGRTEALAGVVAVDPAADSIPSMEVVNGYLKPFDDGLYAAVELGAEGNKGALLTDLLARVTDPAITADATIRAAFDDAAVMLGAALLLAGQTPALDGALLGRAQARADTFLAEPIFARPIGFYTWNPALAAIFTRDRFLQNGDENESFAAFAALAFVLGGDAGLLARYQAETALYAGLTNPFATYPVDALVPYVPTVGALTDVAAIQAAFAAANPSHQPCASTTVAFLPASRSKETDFFDTALCTGTLPAGTNLLDALVAAIRAGAVDLAPQADSGWYDYQLYALETFLLPERAPEDQNLLLTAGYKKKLVDTFKSILIQTRETHVKQLSGATDSAYELPPTDAYPLFPVEPFATFYLRTARGYRFLRTFLQATEGASFLSSTARLVEGGGRATATLADELDRRITLLYGLAFVSADAVGMARDQGLMPDELAELDANAAVTAARTWLTTWKTDADVVQDPRVIVPLVRNDDGTVSYEAVVGVTAVRSRAAYVAGHEPLVTPTDCWSGKLIAHDYTLLVEASVEVVLPPGRQPPTRDELRAICDAHTTTDEIVHALESP
ncbi:MAG TPA: hypothetical protein VGP07_09180 [Polyangia bacterium]